MNLASTAAASLALAAALSAQSPRALYRIDSPSPGQWLQIQQHFDALDGCCGVRPADGPAHFVATKAQRGLVASLLPTAQFVRDARPFHQTYAEALANSGVDNPPTQYYTVAEIEAAIDAEVAAHPGIAAKVDLSALPGAAQTWNGNSIYALKVSDNVSSDEDEPAILVIAQHHARELNSPHMVIGAMNRVPLLADIPYPVQMEPNLVVEFYSR